MSTDLVTEEHLGPAMLALTRKQQAFVLAMMESANGNMTDCARKAGYVGDNNTLWQRAFVCSHNPKVIAALREVVDKTLRSGGPIATRALFEVASDPTHKDRVKAAEALLNRSGHHALSEHKMTVVHTMDDKEMIARIKNLAGTLGLDAQKLIGTAGVVEGEFEVVDDWTALDE